ncbi:MAG: hypothetical protein NVS1B7_2490 [Candidatus Saccharimonadales bacterium]
MNIVLALLEQNGHYLLQRRDSNVQKGAAGLVGCFGGKIELNESPVQAMVRELHEETSYMPEATTLLYIGEVHVTSDHIGKPVQVDAKIFTTIIPAGIELLAKDGTLVRLLKDEARLYLPHMTPATHALFKAFIL